MSIDQRDLDAAERALGLDPRDAEGPQGARHREAWETRFAALSDFLAPVAPPPDMLPRILADIRARDAKVVALTQRRARGWQVAALVAMAACVAMAIFIGTRLSDPGQGAQPDSVIVLMTPDGAAPTIVVALDAGTGTAVLSPYAVEVAADRSLELWQIADGAAPRSLGLLAPDGPTRIRLDPADGDTLAVSLEPAGGAPGGAPTGAIVYTGKLRAIVE